MLESKGEELKDEIKHIKSNMSEPMCQIFLMEEEENYYKN